MKKIIFYFLFLLIFIRFNWVLSQNKSAIDLSLGKCLDKNPTTAGNLKCIDTAYKNWGKELNKYYKLLLKKLNKNEQQKLKKSQLNWIKFRDLEFVVIGSIYAKMQGTMFIPMEAYDRMQIIKDRVLEIKKYYELFDINK